MAVSSFLLKACGDATSIAAAALCSSFAQAQPLTNSANAPLTLERALLLSGSTAPSIEAAEAGVRAANAGRAVASLRPNPSLNGGIEYFGGTGDYRGLRRAEATIGVALPIERGGKRSARIAVANAQRDQSTIALAMAAADLRLAVTQSYNEATAADRRVTTAREQSRIAAEAARAANVRVRAGRASPLEEQRADVLRINAHVAVERAQRLADVSRANLGRRIGRQVTEPLDVAWFDRVTSPSYDRPSSSPTGSTLAVTAANAELTTADAQIRLAQAQRSPDLTVNAGVRRIQETGDFAAVLGVSIPIPVFNRGNEAVAQARAQRDRADALRQVARLEAAQTVASADADVANAAASARTAMGPALAAATEAARIARIGYREGKFGQLDLLEAERTLAETRTAAIDALAAYHDAQARLERLTAAPLDLSRIQP